MNRLISAALKNNISVGTSNFRQVAENIRYVPNDVKCLYFDDQIILNEQEAVKYLLNCGVILDVKLDIKWIEYFQNEQQCQMIDFKNISNYNSIEASILLELSKYYNDGKITINDENIDDKYLVHAVKNYVEESNLNGSFSNVSGGELMIICFICTIVILTPGIMVSFIFSSIFP